MLQIDKTLIASDNIDVHVNYGAQKYERVISHFSLWLRTDLEFLERK